MCKMERGFDRTYIKKGPWSNEEDEVLQNHVRKYGPRDWSSIRSKGLLPRTGKSCRLRWVNKLRPNLKTGCKFTAEEERVVIELQAQYGNKWAKIATQLEGRTDNDVKNFWSSRRKRLERMLRNSSRSKPQKNKGKAPLNNQVQHEEDPSCSSNKPEETQCYNHIPLPNPASHIGNTEEFKMVNLSCLTMPNYHHLEAGDLNHNAVEVDDPYPLHLVPSFESAEYSFPQLLEPQLDFPLLPEPIDSNFIDLLDHKMCWGTTLPALGLEGNSQSSTRPDGFFEDYPTGIFDCFDNAPTSSKQ